MITSYYKLPLDTLGMANNKEVDKCDIKQSIINFIHLITTSYFGECSFDETFGCSIWNVDFDNLTSTNKLRNTITESLVDSITSQEKRLKKVTVEVMIQQEEFKNRGNLNRIKKRVDINVNGIIKQTNEPFACLERFYIAPLSY
ncbi:GPW/gp25 family protein [Aquimarina sp. 2201CG5-10]|uniref:GPW/gp25 family protein n=1 Tax=Aquimarina callyspongiae TaxID=3098150 RepID=UPI002AB4B4BE|nr:GPW/gp25 family protein [Aquimarina sp. 2201CG5-10]MDY8138343.1 GPW/gp25 family protein [Aquimarina sp. 2201CG5-10]